MLIHDRATPLARRRTPEGFLEMRACIGRAGLYDDRADGVGGATESTLVAELRTAIEERDTEIAALKARAAADVRSLDRRAAERGRVAEVARRVLGDGFDAPVLCADEIRRMVLAVVLGPNALHGRGEAYVVSAFDTLAALPFAPRLEPTSPLAALQACNAALATAWRPKAIEVGGAAATADTSGAGAATLSYLTEPRDVGGKWTNVAGFSSKTDTGIGMRIAGNLGSSAERIKEAPDRGDTLVDIGFLNLSNKEVNNPGFLKTKTIYPVAYPDGWQACHEKCLQETDHIRGPQRPALYRKCVRQCLGPDADY